MTPYPGVAGLVMASARPAVLIADDERDIRLLIARILREHAFSVLTASDGEDALEQLARHPVSLVICNLRMPRVSGPALYGAVAPVCPVLAGRFVFCSGDTLSDDCRAVLMRSGRPFLQKPFDIDELLRVALELAGPPIQLSHRAYQQAQAHLYAGTSGGYLRQQRRTLRNR
jgi:CheY-like chemotaxis protein